MSATNRGTKREKSDHYPTPYDLARASVGLLHLEPGARVLEPSAGDGSAYVRALYEVHGIVADAVEYRRAARASLERCLVDVGGPELPRVRTQRFETVTAGGYDAIVGNPPFKIAEEHVRHGLFLLRPGGVLAFLLRLNFYGSKKRRPFWRTCKAWRVYVCESRPDFTGGGGDATEYAFFVWKRGYHGITGSRTFSWEDPRLAEADRAEILREDYPEHYSL